MTSDLVKYIKNDFKEWLLRKGEKNSNIAHHLRHATTILNDIDKNKWSFYYYLILKKNVTFINREYSEGSHDHWEWTHRELTNFFNDGYDHYLSQLYSN